MRNIAFTPPTTEQLASYYYSRGQSVEYCKSEYMRCSRDMRGIAAKAKAHPKGKSRGYTEAEATESADRMERLATEVSEGIAALLKKYGPVREGQQ